MQFREVAGVSKELIAKSRNRQSSRMSNTYYNMTDKDREKIAKWLKNWNRNIKYSIYRDGKKIEENLPNWRTALAHARKWQYDLFENVRKVEILNQWTGEIFSLEEAEERLKKWLKTKGASQ